MKSTTLDHVVTLSRDQWFIEQFPTVRHDHQFTDFEALLGHITAIETRLVILLDEIISEWPGWSGNHLVIYFHDYSRMRSGKLCESDNDIAFNRDDSNAYVLTNKIIEHMIE